MVYSNVRDVGKYGIVKDIAPFDLPASAWSDGANVIFSSGRVTSSPIFRNLSDKLPELDAIRYVTVRESSSEFDTIVLVTPDYKVYEFQNETLNDVSPVGVPVSNSPTKITHANLSGTLYLNRRDQLPIYYDKLGGVFKPLPAWDETWRTSAIRSYKDFAVALNVSKGTFEYPAMVKWSDATLAGSPPSNWDIDNEASMGGENILSEATDAIIDGVPLKNNFIIYTGNEVFDMEFIGVPNIFRWSTLFTDDGAMSQNCAIEVQGKHYVFGRKDIYVHDGVSKKSLAEGRVKQYVFGQLSTQNVDKCFVFHAPKINSVYFCFQAAYDEARYRDTPYCNRAAIYNYVTDCWSFVDMPNVSSASYGNLDTRLTYAQADTQAYAYDNIGGTYADQADSYSRHVVMSSLGHPESGLTANRVLALDGSYESLITKPTHPELIQECYVARAGLTLSEMGLPLNVRKMSTTLYPLVQFIGKPSDFTVRFGQHEYPDAYPVSEPAIPFNPKTTYKVNTRNTGRFLGIRYDFPSHGGVYLSGYDVEVIPVSGR